MIVTCPCGCEYSFDAKRRPNGSGTKPSGEITERQSWLLTFLKAFPTKQRDKHEIQDLIYPKDLPHEQAPPGWGDHEVQIALSALVGRGLIRMYDPYSKLPRYEVIR